MTWAGVALFVVVVLPLGIVYIGASVWCVVALFKELK